MAAPNRYEYSRRSLGAPLGPGPSLVLPEPEPHADETGRISVWTLASVGLGPNIAPLWACNVVPCALRVPEQDDLLTNGQIG
jgi:hypothetical protein